MFIDRMFGAFSRLFKKPDTSPAGSTPTVKYAKETQSREGLSRNGTPEVKFSARDNSTSSPKPDDIQLPLSSIIKLLPTELWGQLAPAGVADCHLRIPRQSVLKQLSGGAVKIRFGEIRRFAPAGVLIANDIEDARLINLPLSEIITQLDAGIFACRTDQRQVAVPTDVPDVFGAKAFNAPLRVMSKREVTTEFATKGISTKTSQASRGEPQGSQAPNQSIGQEMHEPVRTKPLPASGIATVPFQTGISAQLSTLQQTHSGEPEGKRTSIPFKSRGPLAQGSFTIGLDNIAEHWPDAIRQELAQLKIPDGKIALPPIEVCEGLKRGRVQYPWARLRSWIQPPVERTCSVHDEQVLELPLEKLTPVFLDFIRSNPINRDSAAADNITEFFRRAEQSFGSPEGAVDRNAFESSPNRTQTSISENPKDLSEASAGELTRPPNTKSLRLRLSALASAWPDPILRDIAQFKLENASIDFPLDSIEVGLKTGRVQFSWQQVCSWLAPASIAAQHSINGDVVVQLPLAHIAPHFLKLKTSVQAKPKLDAVADIPDIFSSNKSAAVASEVAGDGPVTGVKAEALVAGSETCNQGSAKTITNLSQLFGEPGKASWTPNEIVKRATNLPGVIGAVIALQDGLLVASSLPSDIKTEMVAAFIPQIFGRLNQYSKELQLGCATSVAFTIEMGTLQIYNAGLIYFAALCTSQEEIPAGKLQIIATELSRHTK